MNTARLILILLVLLGFAAALFAEEAEQIGEALFKHNWPLDFSSFFFFAIVFCAIL
jgi:hypothetical protein